MLHRDEANNLARLFDCFSKSQDDACHAAKHDDEDWAEAIDLLSYESEKEKEDAEPEVLMQEAEKEAKKE